MNPDDPVCLCFHVTRRKVQSFIRVEKPRRPSQLSQCFGAGTGCGWCRPYLERMLTQSLEQSGAEKKSSQKPDSSSLPEPGSSVDSPDTSELTLAEYKKARAKYVREGGGTPPSGAVPIDNDEG